MTDAFLDQAWTMTSDLSALKKHYAAASKDRADVALALARAEVLDAEVGGALDAEGSGALVLPLVLARALAVTDDARPIAPWLEATYRVMDPAAKRALVALTGKCQAAVKELRSKKKQDPWQIQRWQYAHVLAAGCLARVGDTREAEMLLPANKWLLRALVPQGVALDAAIASIEQIDHEEAPLREVSRLLPVLAISGVSKAVPAMIALLRSGIAIHALRALAMIRDDRAAEAARALLRETGGRPWDVHILMLAAQGVLRAHGESFPLDVARDSYAWPFVDYHTPEEDALVIRWFAVDALARGDDKDRALARAQVSSPYRTVREAALSAFEQRPKLTGWDKGRVAWAKDSDPKALLGALDDPHAFDLHNVVQALSKDPKAGAKVLAFARARLQAPTGPRTWYSIKPDAERKVYVGVAHKGDAEDDEERAEPPPTSPGAFTVRRFDLPASWFPDLVHMALAADVERMVVVAAKEAFLFDPQKNERLGSLGSGEGVRACAISPDGQRVALAKTDAVVVLDEKGLAVSRVDGTADVVGLSADGAIACGDSKTLRAGDVVVNAPGACRGVVWLGPKRAVFLCDGGKNKSALVDVDVAKKKHAVVSVAASTMVASYGKLLVTGAGKTIRLHDAKLKTKIDVDCEQPITAIGVESDKVLWVATQEKVQRVRIGGKAPKLEDATRFAVQDLVAAGGRAYGWFDGTIVRIHDDDDAVYAQGSHFEQLTAVVALPDKRVVSAGWEGRVLLWKPEGGVGETLFDRSARVDSLGVAGGIVYIPDGRNVRAVDLATKTTTFIVGGDDVEADLIEHMPEVKAVAAGEKHVAWGGAGAIHVLDRKTGEEVATVEAAHEFLVFDDAGNVYGGSEKGRIACVATDGTVRWSRVEHGIDVLDGTLHGNPHRDCAALATRGPLLASLASDDTVRVFDGVTGKRVLRWFRNVGIFNRVAISPSQKLVAFTWDDTLEVVDIAGAKTVAVGDCRGWPGGAHTELMALDWVDDETLVVGAKNGALYRVALSSGA